MYVGGEWIHVYPWLNPFAAHLTLSQHCESAKPQHKIKSPLKKDTALCPPVIGPQLQEWTDTSAHWQKDNPTAIKSSADNQEGRVSSHTYSSRILSHYVLIQQMYKTSMTLQRKHQ